MGCARALLGAGATVDAADENGWTPLWHAAAKRRYEAARVLIGHGASLAHASRSASSLRAVVEPAQLAELESFEAESRGAERVRDPDA